MSDSPIEKLVFDVIKEIVPQVRIFIVDGTKINEIERYLSFTYPAVGEHVMCGGTYYEVYRVTHDVFSKVCKDTKSMGKPHIDCYCFKNKAI